MGEGAGRLTAADALRKAVEELTGGSAAYFYAELFARAAALMIGDEGGPDAPAVTGDEALNALAGAAGRILRAGGDADAAIEDLAEAVREATRFEYCDACDEWAVIFDSNELLYSWDDAPLMDGGSGESREKCLRTLGDRAFTQQCAPGYLEDPDEPAYVEFAFRPSDPGERRAFMTSLIDERGGVTPGLSYSPAVFEEFGDQIIAATQRDPDYRQWAARQLDRVVHARTSPAEIESIASEFSASVDEIEEVSAALIAGDVDVLDPGVGRLLWSSWLARCNEHEVEDEQE